MSEHAILPPSDADTWVVCTAKPLMVRDLQFKLPEKEEHVLAAKDGTASHWAMAELAAERVVAEGQITDDGHVLSQEMIDGAQMLIDDVVATLPDVPRQHWRVEQRVSMARRIHPHNWGTPDLWVFVASTWTIYVWDYKFGHNLVEVFENWQLMDYLAGIMETLGIDAITEQRVKVVFTIVQPRGFHPEGPIRRWEVSSAANLRGYHNRLEMAAEEAMSGFAAARPNANCIYCEARHVCQALQKDAYRSAQISLQAVPLLMSPDAIGLELAILEDAAERLKARISGLATQGEAMIRSHKAVPGWEIVSEPSREKWKDPKLAAKIGRTLKVNIVKEETLLTPRQAREAGMPVELVAELAERGKPSQKFKRVEESRGRRLFGKY